MNGSAGPVTVGTGYPRDLSPADDSIPLDTMTRTEVLNDTGIDCVYISSATGRHFDDCRAALTAGKNILVEKPICLRADEVRELDALAHEQGRTVFECLSYPYHPAWGAFVEEAALLARAPQVAITASFRIPERPAEDFRWAAEHGGAVADLGTYCVDALLRLGAPASALRPSSVRSPGRETGSVRASHDGASTRTTYRGLWSIGERYENVVSVSDGIRRIELERVFSFPPNFAPRIRRRRSVADDRTAAFTIAPANMTELCLKTGSKHIVDPETTGVVHRDGILRRVSVLEAAATRAPTTRDGTLEETSHEH